jgi:hypothetical protein
LENSLVVVLIISAAGMTLLFLALAFFYGLLTLLTSMARDRAVAEAVPAEAGEEAGVRLRAAAIAVALARAEAEQRGVPAAVMPEDGTIPGGVVSSWWTLHHQRQVASNSAARRIR